MLELPHILPLLLVLNSEFLLSDGVLLFRTHTCLRIVPGEHSPLLLDFFLRLVPHLPLNREPQQPYSVGNQVFLDPLVKWGVRRERGRVVNLEEPGL